jgi:ribosomal protein L37AE/L43A
MAAHAGEKAERTGDFRCAKCHQRTHVKAGEKIPKCPHCGGETFDTREHEPGNKSS